MIRLFRALLMLLFGIGYLPLCAAQDPGFTEQEQEWIASHPVINVAVGADWRPLEYVENGVYKGLSAEYLKAISRVSGLQFRWVPGASWSEAREALNKGQVELLPAVSEAFSTPALRDRIAYSQPYFAGSTLIVTRANSPTVYDPRQLSGKKVAIKGGGGYERSLREHYPGIQLLTVVTPSEALDLVATGEAEAAIDVDTALLPIMQRRYLGALHIAGTIVDMPAVVSMGVSRDQPLLLSIINKSIGSLTALETDQMIERWVVPTDYGLPSWPIVLHYYRWQALAAACLFALFAVLVYRALKARRRAERSERDKAMFLAVMSHEIRTPMSAILSSIELLERAKLAPEEARLAKVAASGANGLLELLDDVLDFSKMEAKKVTLDCKASDIAGLAREAVSIAEIRAQEKGLPLMLKLRLEEGVWPVIDAQRVRQVLNNLISNAVKFTAAGRVEVSVDLSTAQEDSALGVLSIKVEDSGIGIAKRAQSRLFRAFAQADQSTTRQFGGTGLGLRICKDLVELMQGDIQLHSQPGKGTVVEVRIPVALTRQAASAAPLESLDDSARQATAEQHPEDYQPASLTVLVVEDHPQNRFVIERQLHALGYAAVLVETGQAALDSIAETAFDIVLLDCNLPDIDGYTVASRIRQNELGSARHVPIIAISAMVGPEHLDASLSAGIDGVLSKPLRLNELRATIEMWCDTGQSLTPAVMDEPATATNLHEEFLLTSEADLAKLRQAVSAADWRQVARTAHRIVGAALSLGRPDIAGFARAIEQEASAPGLSALSVGAVQRLESALRNSHGPEQADHRS
ncbi:transporter substrate-binding domain-containing protein [Pseudomonas sp. SWRI99]|uniref:ATP-binding protein n=1 Tax=Pseudomonas sp. SWRI99 TaxID=2745506 RepID=UPI001646695D|nr:transporter substrate-binding domain-containing protein [Pseudomonas sp. SWRI99]MBC3776850.1 transporter substrate-binding domain-containing protein [Pseudomonas sp. SWRI99]